MRKQNFILSIVAMAALLLGTVSCEKEFDTPPARTIAEGMLLDINDLRQILADSGAYKFVDDFNIYATVTADGVTGNFFKQVYIQDDSSACNMRTIEPDGLYEGDYIRVNLNGAWVSEYGGMLQIDSVSIDEQVVIQANQQFITPKLVTLDQIGPEIQGQLVTIEDVEFVDSEISAAYADAVNLQSVNRNLRDCDGNTILVRTSGYASFASALIPGGNGTFTGIVGQFNDDMQLFIRKTEEVELNNLRCDGSTGEYILFKNFEDGSVTSGGWNQQVVVGSDQWDLFTFSGNTWGRITNWNGTGNDPSENWLISPSVDLSETINPILSFLTTTNFDGAGLETYVSTDYQDGTPVDDATWTVLDAQYSPINGGWEDTESGPVNLSAYISNNVHIAFRYTGSASDGATWEVDNIVIYDAP